MGLDVYVGPLCRWYSGDWKTIVQQYAEANGIAFHAVYANPPPQNRATSDQAREAILIWRSRLHEVAAGRLPPLVWEERPDGDYYTDKPDWDGYWALRLLAARIEFPEEKAPREVPLPSKMGDPSREPLIRRVELAYSGKSSPTRLGQLFGRRGPTVAYPQFRHLQGPECWLPVDFDAPFTSADVAGNRLTFGSAPRLLGELRGLNALTVRGSPDALAGWLRDGVSEDDRRLETVARYGLAAFSACAEYAVARDVPMRLDY